MLQILIWLICFAMVAWATGVVIQTSGQEREDQPKTKAAASQASILLWVVTLAAGFFAWLAWDQGQQVGALVGSMG